MSALGRQPRPVHFDRLDRGLLPSAFQRKKPVRRCFHGLPECLQHIPRGYLEVDHLLGDSALMRSCPKLGDNILNIPLYGELRLGRRDRLELWRQLERIARKSWMSRNVDLHIV